MHLQLQLKEIGQESQIQARLQASGHTPALLQPAPQAGYLAPEQAVAVSPSFLPWRLPAAKAISFEATRLRLF
jgi:hypothetical protein